MTDRNHSVEKEVRGAKDYTEILGKKEESRGKNLEFAGGFEKGQCPVAKGKGPSLGNRREVTPQAFLKLGTKLVPRSTDFPTTSTAVSTALTKLGPTFTAFHHHRSILHLHHHDASAGNCSAALSNG